MNIVPNLTVRRRTMTVAVGLAAIVTTGYVPSSASADTPAGPSACHWTTDQLPRTPDAVEGWYRGCQVTQLGTPDATEGWLG